MFEELLAKEINEIGGIKLVSAVYNKKEDCLLLSLSYPDGQMLSKDQKDRIKDIAKKISDVGIKNISVQLKKAYVSNELAISAAKCYFEANYPLMYSFSKDRISAEILDGEASITVETGEDIKEYICDRNIKENTEKYLSAQLVIPVHVKFEYIDVQDDSDEEYKIEVVQDANDQKHRFVKIFNKQKYVGEEITDQPIYISDVKSACDYLVICGQINYYALKEYTSKSGKIKHLAKFMLKDPTGEFNVFMFVSETNYPKMEKLENGIEIVVSGSCEEGKYGNLELKCKDISLCEIEKNFVEEFVFKEEPKEYLKVFPEKIEYNEQINLFDTARKISPFLANNEVVVFDLETTGLNFTDSEIIEIGAIKIKKGGVISEKFSTFVKPKKPVPIEITQLTGITNEDVSTGVDLETAIADFYKFTRGTILVGHNVSFDYGFINYYGKKVGYDFSTNPQQDTYALAQKYIPGMKNYKLKTVAERFGVSLKNAHRAYHDAYATAEVFIKLTDFFE